MTDDSTANATATVDDRGRAAAAAVRSVAADRPVPAFDPDVVRISLDRRGSGGGRRPLVAGLTAAAAVLVVVAAVVALAGRDQPDSAPADRTPTDGARATEVQRFVLAQAPDGYVLGGVYDAAEDDVRPSPYGPLAVYGPDAGHPTLGVALVLGSTEAPTAPDPSAVIPADEVGGRQAWRVDDSAGAVSVAVGGSSVTVIGVTATDEEVLAAAAAVTVTGDRAEVPADALPDGWGALGSADVLDLSPGAGALSTVGGGQSWIAAYGSAADGQITVSVAVGDPIRARAAMIGTEDTEDVDIRGHTALLIRADYGSTSSTSVTWEEQPGLIVQVASVEAVEEATLVDLAQDLVPVAAADVAGLRREALEVEVATSGQTVVGRGTFSDGTEWVLLASTEPGSTLELRTTGGASASGSTSFSGGGSSVAVGEDGEPSVSPPSPFPEWAAGYEGDAHYILGRADAETVTVEVRDSGSGAVVATATVMEGGGVRGWVAELPTEGGTPVYELVALAADGTELGTEQGVTG